MQIRFKSLHREIQFVEAASQKSFDVIVRTRNCLLILSLVGNNVRFVDGAQTYGLALRYFMAINEDRLV